MSLALDLTDEQRMIRDSVRAAASSEFAPIAIEIDETQRFPHENFKRLKELGVMGISLPEAYGGGGADYLSYVLVMEEIARVCASTALGYAAHHTLGSWPIYAFGTEAQKRKYLPPLASGEALGAYGLTEPGAGSDSGATRSTAVKHNGHYLLNGSKCFTTNGSHAASFIVSAKTDPNAQGSRGISAFILEKGMPGFTVGRKEDKLGMRGSDTVALHFEGCRVPADQLLGTENEGFKIFMKTLDNGRISIGALALGIAQGAFDKASAYARERKAFGRPIGAFQAIGNMIADMATEIEAARHLIYHAARLRDAGRPFTREAAMAKLYASEMSMRACTRAVQILGGYGYMRAYEVERFLRDAKLCEIGEGTSEIQRLVIARQVLGRL
jgi:butyryl-CoA dehydrogenase